MDKKRFDEVHACYLLLKEVKKPLPEMETSSAGSAHLIDFNQSMTSGVPPRSMSAQVQSSKTPRRPSEQLFVPPQQQLNNAQVQTTVDAPATMNAPAHQQEQQSQQQTQTSKIAPSSTASTATAVSFRHAPLNNRQPALSIQPNSHYPGSYFMLVRNQKC